MPLYLWECENCKKEVEVLRPMEEHDVIPTTEEAGPHSEECKEPKYARRIGGITKQYGASWGSDRKGYYGSRW